MNQDIIDLAQIKNAFADAQTITQFINGDEHTEVTSRLGHTYPSLANVLRIIEATAQQKLKQVPSIEALRKIDAQAHKERITVDAYYEDGLVGGGEFIADTKDTHTADDGGLVIVSQGGTRWKRQIFGGEVSLVDFGVLADGRTDTTSQLNQALLSCAGRYVVVAPEGTILFSQEIKLPSHLTLRGSGMDKTFFKATDSLPAISNGMTNIDNNYEKRSTYDVNIHISDFTLDHNHARRYRIGNAVNNQACGIKYSAVRGGSIMRVKVVGAVLHCFDIAADQYVSTGGVTANATNMSQDIAIADCVAIDPYRDDCFTTHNSRNITIDRCLAVHTGNITPLGNTQQGFEIDEGSEYISIRNCRAVNLYCGYQSKGHDGTKPARGVTFSDCIAEGCAYSYMASIGTNLMGKRGYDGQAVTFNNCTVLKPTKRLNTQPIALYIYGADGIVVNGFTVDGDARMVITAGAKRIAMRDVIFNAAITVGEGCIESDAGTPCFLMLDNISSIVQQTLPMVAKLASGAIIKAQNLYMRGDGVSAIKLNRNAQDAINNAWNWGYGNTIYLITENYGLTGSVDINPHNQVSMTGTPNSNVKAPVGTVIRSGGSAWVQMASDGNTPNWTKIY